ncbi:MAG: hypothetical protein IKN57_11800, partial [Parasporobacterium sp.]|nr:hypothetical protein [Parasporobacterium sp.]
IAGEHDFDEGGVTREATCMEEGEKTYICRRCGEIRTEAIGKIPHSFVIYINNNDATCQRDGTETALCVYGCGTQDTRTMADSRIAHQYVNGICTMCGEKDPGYIDGNVNGTVSGNHGANGWYVGPVSISAPAGYSIRERAGWGSEPSPADFGNESVINPAVQEGTNTINYYLMKNDSKAIVERSVTVRIDTIAPQISGAVNGGVYCGTVRTILRDANVMTVKINGVQARNTVSNGGAIDHNVSGSRRLEVSDEAGNTTSIAFTVNASHTWDAGSIVRAATCMQKGERIYTCINCGEVRKEEIPLIPHSFTNYINNNNATCQKDGTQTAYCDYNCGTTNTIPVEGSRVGHNFVNYVYNNDASCTKNGTKTGVCSYGCGTTNTVEAEGSMIPHLFKNYVYDNNATCQKDGTKTAYCEYGCQTKDTITADGTKVGHKFVNYVYNNDASCKQDGTKTAVCEFNCGAKDTITAPATRLPHKFVNGVCSVCGIPDPNFKGSASTTPSGAAPTAAAQQPTTASSQATGQVLGIFDSSQPVGMVLIMAGIAMTVLAGLLIVRKRNGDRF